MSNDETPHPLLSLARKKLHRWDLSLECSGAHSWIQTTAQRKRYWLILPSANGEIDFEPLD
jgi:hypothetical protein